MKIRIAQLIVDTNIDSNRDKILKEISQTKEDEWIVFPEAILSGYYPSEKEYTKKLDRDKIRTYLNEIEEHVIEKRCHCLLGSASTINQVWYNSIYFFSYLSKSKRHDKKYLSKLDKTHFVSGEKLKKYSLGDIDFGMLACRELIFPQEWISLKQSGVKIVFHLNNAIQPHDILWKHILISRAIENSIFVVSVNNGEKLQKLGSYIIKPNGKIIAETNTGCEETISVDINLNEVTDDLSKREDY